MERGTQESRSIGDPSSFEKLCPEVQHLIPERVQWPPEDVGTMSD
jgi:hypothetical protein